MAQTIQIVPKFSFPSVETYINDYTKVVDEAVTAAEDTSVKQIYAVKAGKGKDNVWIKKSNRTSAEFTFGKSNFSKYGQPLMQAYQVLDKENSSVWMMRVMPTTAPYAVGAINIAYNVVDTDTQKDTIEISGMSEDKTTATINKGDVPTVVVPEVGKLYKLTSGDIITYYEWDSATSLYKETTDINLKAFKVLPVKVTKPASIKGETDADIQQQLVTWGTVTKDKQSTDPYTYAPVFTAKYSGRGQCGNDFALRVINNTIAEKDYGITLYEFDVLDKSNGYTNTAQYIGGLVSTVKYNDASSLISDVLEDAEVGLAPIDIYANEGAVEKVYDAYIKFLKTYGKYYGVENAEDYVDLDCFDVINGNIVGTTTKLAGFVLGSSDDIGTESGQASTADIAYCDLSSTTGLELVGGADVDADYNALYADAFAGNIDNRIKSSRIMDITVFCDANYDDTVKDAIISTVLLRNNARAFMDTYPLTSVTTSDITSLKSRYGKYSSEEFAALISFDCWNYITRDPDTKKRVNVTASYFIAPAYVDHVNNLGIHIPFVMENARLTNFIKNSVKPAIYEYSTDIKEALYNARFNYIECYGENVYYRSVQNTMQTDVTDLLEENNAAIVYDLKKKLEIDANSQLYNFADDEVRNDFIEFEKAKYSEWVGSRLESFDIMFAVSEYEFNHLILHLYVDIVLRGLTKHITTEIDINKRTYAGTTTSADEVTE